MRTTQQFSITLPYNMAEVVEGKIKSGAYASVSEVVREGVRALLERDAAIERWLREEVVAGQRGIPGRPIKRRSGRGNPGPHQGPARVRGAIR
jgi:antitoxin ParD1/3/4